MRVKEKGRVVDQYLIYTIAHGYGDFTLWWKPKSKGYTFDIDAAGTYTKGEVDSIERTRGKDFGVPYHLVNSLPTQRIVLRENLPNRDQMEGLK